MSSVKGFGATGDGKADDTAAIEHAVRDGDGILRFPRGKYRIARTIEIPLDRVGTLGIDGSGGTATVIMSGPGPAFRIVGTHGGTGDPSSVKPNVWDRQRMPTVRNLEVTGDHPAADGFELIETMQSLFEGVLVRGVRHGIRLHRRNRNVLISHSHIYHNTGVGVYLDRVNLHQINIVGNHISYNRLGGIRVEGSEVRNLQITGNDIEYNNHKQFGVEPEPTAEIYIDTRAERASVNEATVASNTIQATASPGGANIRIVEKRDASRPPGLITISGNLIGNQENNVHLTGCYGVVLSGNFINSCVKQNLLIEDSSQINITGNSFRRHTPGLFTGVRLVDSRDCVLQGCTIQDEDPAGQKREGSLLELSRCRRISIQGSQVLDGAPFGIDIEDSREININGCTVADTREKPLADGSVRFRGAGEHNLIAACTLGQTLQLDPTSRVATANLVGSGAND